jgi:starch phosphorylase
MTVLAMRLCGRSNAVSRLHRRIARRMWHSIWPDRTPEAVPIISVTNAIHTPSWLARELGQSGHRVDERADGVDRPDDDNALWARHETLRSKLVDFVRLRLVAQLRQRGCGQAEIDAASGVLDKKHLTVGLARRFAGYKRATLLLSEPDRLERLVNREERPIQFIFSGKAHPHDDGGKQLIQELLSVAKEPPFRARIVFLEDYDLNVARFLVQGVDVWLNTPRRPLEASGTSGMKAVANGALHLSTLDGWWDEAFRPALGWAIGDRRTYADPLEQDEVDRSSLFELLENEVAPLFYERDSDGLPRRWIAMMRASMTELTPRFSADRMLSEYQQRLYEPAARQAARTRR